MAATRVGQITSAATASASAKCGASNDGVEAKTPLQAGQHECREHGANPAQGKEQAVAEGRGVQVSGSKEGKEGTESHAGGDEKSGAGRNCSQSRSVGEVAPPGRDGAQETFSSRCSS